MSQARLSQQRQDHRNRETCLLHKTHPCLEKGQDPVVLFCLEGGKKREKFSIIEKVTIRCVDKI